MEDYWPLLGQMMAMKLPTVWVVRTVGSRPDHECVIGDGMAKTLHAAGCVGLVTDGGVRDIAGLLSTPFAAYCRGRTIHHCALRMRNMNQPIEIGGITVAPGDVIHANAEGVIKIPQSCLEALPARASQMRLAEHEVHRTWRRTDISLEQKERRAAEVFARLGFTAATLDRAKH
jgi:4-hydroxy-4-methyl-2-oxoglutarate aldolase